MRDFVKCFLLCFQSFAKHNKQAHRANKASNASNVDMRLARLRTHDNGKRGDEKNKNGKGKNNKEFHNGEKVAFYQLTRKYFFLFFIYFFCVMAHFFVDKSLTENAFFIC